MNDRVASSIEHTLLVARATASEVDALCEEAVLHGFHGVCVNPLHVPRAVSRLGGARPCVVSVVGFPLGASHPEIVAAEASRAVAEGASEIDMVIPIGAALSGDLEAVERAVRVVREAVLSATLKVILETGHFDGDSLLSVAAAAAKSRPDFLKTSTGFGPRGASVDDVRILLSVTDGRIPVKAAGGIRDRATALAMLDAGATRLGTSSGVAIVTGAASAAGY